MHNAATYGNDELLKILKDFGLDINAKNNEGLSSVHRAIENGLMTNNDQTN